MINLKELRGSKEERMKDRLLNVIMFLAERLSLFASAASLYEKRYDKAAMFLAFSIYSRLMRKL